MVQNNLNLHDIRVGQRWRHKFLGIVATVIALDCSGLTRLVRYSRNKDKAINILEEQGFLTFYPTQEDP